MNKTRKQIILSLSFLLFMFLAVGMTSIKADAATGFKVSGTKLYDANGNEFVMRGVNHAHTWYKDNSATALKGIADAGCNTVRIVLSDGAVWSKDDLSSINSLISMCKEYHLVAILEVHDATGSDSTSDLNKAVDYWLEMKSALVGNESYVILNIANEWYGTWNSTGWKDGYVSAIKRIRDAGISNTIMVDCAGWGQYPQSIADYGTTVKAADYLDNTMFSIHMYEYAGGDSTTVRNNIDNALNKGLCLTIGEFGGQHTNGDVDEDTIMSYCTQKNVGYLGWSWKGNSSELSYLDIANDWSGSSLTTWGNRLINGSNGIKATAKTCTVFNGSYDGDDDGDNTKPINLFYGSSTTSNWGQAVKVFTSKNGGPFNPSVITNNGYFWVEYTGGKDALELILQSWSGGTGWAKVSPSETGTTSTGTYYAKFNYSAITNSYGSDFSNLDAVYVGATTSTITVISLDYNVK